MTDIGGIVEFVEAVEFSLCTACLAAKLAPCSATWEKPGCIAESQTEKKSKLRKCKANKTCEQVLKQINKYSNVKILWEGHQIWKISHLFWRLLKVS